MPRFWTRCARVGGGGAFVGGLHQAGPAAGHDVAAERRQLAGDALHLLVDPVARIGARGPEDRDPEALALRGTQARKVVDRRPQTEERVDEDALHAFLVVEADDRGASRGDVGSLMWAILPRSEDGRDDRRAGHT